MRRLSEGGAGGAEDGGGGDEHLHVHKLYTCPCEQPACRSLDCEACASTLSHSDLHQHLAAQELRERLTPPTTSPDALMKPFRLPRNQLRPRGTPSFSPFSGGGIHLQGDERIATLAEASLCHLTLSSSSGDSGFEMDGDTLIVKFVQDGGAAFRAGVRPGMRLVRFLHETVQSSDDILRIMSAHGGQRPSEQTFAFASQRGGESWAHPDMTTVLQKPCTTWCTHCAEDAAGFRGPDHSARSAVFSSCAHPPSAGFVFLELLEDFNQPFSAEVLAPGEPNHSWVN